MRAVLLLLLLLLPQPVLAAETFSMGSLVLQMSWALLLVVGLILAIYGLARRRLLLGRQSGAVINIVAMRPLQPKSTLALVEVRGREFLVGISPAGIHLLAEMAPGTEAPKAPFDQVLAEQHP